MDRLFFFVLALVFVPGLALEGEEPFDDLVPDMNQQLGINTNLQWGDEDIQIVPREELEAAQNPGNIEVEDGQLPEIHFPLPPGINANLEWDDESPIQMVPRDELEDRDRENGVGTGSPVEDDAETGTNSPGEVEDGTEVPVGSEAPVDDEEVNTDAPVDEEAEAGKPPAVGKPPVVGSPEKPAAPEVGKPPVVGSPDKPAAPEVGKPPVVGSPEKPEAPEVGSPEQPESPIAVHPCVKCIAHLKELVQTLGARAALLPY